MFIYFILFYFINIISSEELPELTPVLFLQNQSKDDLKILCPNDLFDGLNFFKSIYTFRGDKNGFWGEGMDGKIQKQKKLMAKIEKMNRGLFDSDDFKKMHESAFIAYPSIYEGYVVKSLFKRRPWYTGNPGGEGINPFFKYPEILRYNSYRLKVWGEKYFYHLNSKMEQPIISEVGEQNFVTMEVCDIPVVVFPSLLSPRYVWSESEDELTTQGYFGLVGSYGVNFETWKTPDYRNFIKDKKMNKKDVEKFIRSIMYTFVAAAEKLTKQYMKMVNWEERDGQLFVCNLGTMKMGIGQFLQSAPLENCTDIINWYIKYLFEALKNFSDIHWRVSFCNLGREFHREYELAVKSIENENKNKNIELIYREGASILDINNYTDGKKYTEKNSLTVLQHSGDSYAVFGNQGYSDGSYERYLIGICNDDYLTPAHYYLNFLLAEVIGKEKIEEAINSESLENDLNKESYKEEERQSLLKRKQRNKKIFVLSLSSVVLSFLWLIFYYKFDYIIKIKSYLYSFFNLDRLRS